MLRQCSFVSCTGTLEITLGYQSESDSSLFDPDIPAVGFKSKVRTLMSRVKSTVKSTLLYANPPTSPHHFGSGLVFLVPPNDIIFFFTNPSIFFLFKFLSNQYRHLPEISTLPTLSESW